VVGLHAKDGEVCLSRGVRFAKDCREFCGDLFAAAVVYGVVKR